VNGEVLSVTDTVRAVAQRLAFVLASAILVVGSAKADEAWDRPAIDILGPEIVFDRLVDIEGRHVECVGKIIQTYPVETADQKIQAMQTFDACRKGPPRNSCAAPFDAARAAQFFYNEYYAPGESSAAPLEAWLAKCARPESTRDSALSASDIRAACKSSILLFPVWYKMFFSSRPLEFGPYTSQNVDNQCGELAPALWSYYGRRCEGMIRIGSERKGLQQDYQATGFFHDYYDEVDWGFCKVLGLGSATASIKRFRLPVQ
jgi:hypothetical protein